MSTKSLILSSAGLKNLVKQEKNFTFFFGEKEITINNVFAEFISPIVSHIHYSDPTINNMHITYPRTSEFPLLNQLFTEDIISFFQNISSGLSIEISKDQAIKIQLLSILIGNEELFHKSNQLFQEEFNLSEIDRYIEYLVLYDSVSNLRGMFNLSFIAEIISKNFYSINKEKLLKLPRPIILSIISNSQLKLESEDSLLDFILELFSSNQEHEENSESISIVTFLEQIDIEKLSEEKFCEFINNVNPSNLTNELWLNLCKKFNSSSSDSTESRYEKPTGKFINYDGNDQNRFNGIIRYLTNECGGNVYQKGVVKVAESSANTDQIHAYNLVDLDNFETRFLSQNKENSWAQYDFGDRKVRPTHYSIRSRQYSKGEYHLKGWVIEGSNTGQNDWKVLDSRSGVTCLDDRSASYTFEIQHKLKNDEFYQYLRIRQTEPNANNNYHMGLSALEYFGYII